MTTKIINNSETAAKVSKILLMLGSASLVTCFITCHPLFFAGACFLLPLAFIILIAVDNN